MAEQKSAKERFVPDVFIYDTTLRDGTQGEGINFTVEDKLRIAERLDEFGIAYVEGGWPGSNPKDKEFFALASKRRWKNAKLAAFGSTRRPKLKAGEDPNLARIVESGAKAAAIFGKSWDFHVTHALRIEPEQNLEMIYDSIRHLKEQGMEVFFDAEHFFDGFKSNRQYAEAALKAASEGGADCLVLCDTNGGTLPWEMAEIVRAVTGSFSTPVGIHVHDDSGFGVCNSVIAVQEGAVQVQGTINGYGERCGNANLCAIIPIIQLKMKKLCVPETSLVEMVEVSRFVDEKANMVPNDRQPFVGRCAFTHKAGVHVDAMMKHPQTYEHIPPEAVGNSRRMLVSELSGAGSIIQKAKKFEVDLSKDSPEVRSVLEHIMQLENEGYSFESAEASFELILKRSLGMHKKLFELKGFRLIIEKRGEHEEPITEATLKISVDGEEAFTVAEGDGPVHALDNALRLALKRFYGRELAKIKLTDFKVRVINTRAATAAKVRTIIESRDANETWTTVGVSENIIEASWNALADSVEYGLLKHLGGNK